MEREERERESKKENERKEGHKYVSSQVSTIKCEKKREKSHRCFGKKEILFFLFVSFNHRIS